MTRTNERLPEGRLVTDLGVQGIIREPQKGKHLKGRNREVGLYRALPIIIASYTESVSAAAVAATMGIRAARSLSLPLSMSFVVYFCTHNTKSD
jgi:hypothetical protein